MTKLVYLRRLPEKQFGAWVAACENAGRGANDIFVTEDTYKCIYVFPELGNALWVKEAFEKITGEVNQTPVSEHDVIIRPSHYEMMGENTIEILAAAMTEAEWRGFCLGNALKYRIRAGKKDDLQQDIDKANNYERLYEEHKHLCKKGKKKPKE